MADAVEQSAGQALLPQCFRPFVKGQVAGDQSGSAFVALRDQFEQQFRSGFGERHEAQLVDDQEVAGSHLLLEPQ